jgi:hypothetical protein
VPATARRPVAARYRLGAVGVDSDVTLDGFEHCLADPSGCPFQVRVRRAGPAPDGGELVLRAVRGDRATEVRRHGDGSFTVTNDAYSTTTVEADGGTIWWHLADRGPTVDDTEFLTTTVIPRALTRAGVPVLHGASILAPGGALLLTGPSGAGKSTAAAALHRATGWPLLGDDAAVLGLADGRPTVRSCARDVRLWEDARHLLGMGAGTRLPRFADGGGKARHTVAEPPRAAVPVRVVARLVPGDEPAVLRTPPAKRVAVTRNQLMRLDRTDRSGQAGEFAFLVQWARMVPMVELRHPRDGIASLEHTVARLTELATSGMGAAGT